MKKIWSSKWVASKQPRKQRKYLVNLPLHKVKDIMHSMLSKELKAKSKNRNSITIRKGDKVKIMRGQFKNKTGTIDKVLNKKMKVYIDVAKMTKKDGSTVYYPIHPSNLQITEMAGEDKRRNKILERSKK